MAGRRITQSSIDWAKFKDALPKSELSNFNAFKAKSDSYLRR